MSSIGGIAATAPGETDSLIGARRRRADRVERRSRGPGRESARLGKSQADQKDSTFGFSLLFSLLFL